MCIAIPRVPKRAPSNSKSPSGPGPLPLRPASARGKCPRKRPRDESLSRGWPRTKSQERFWTANAGPKGSAQGRSRATRQDADFAPIKKARRVSSAGRLVFLIEHNVPVVAVSLRHGHLFHSAETLGLAPRPNLKGPRVNTRVGSFLTTAAKVAAALTRARVDLRISASLSSARLLRVRITRCSLA
jgi:hypothetical protein